MPNKNMQRINIADKDQPVNIDEGDAIDGLKEKLEEKIRRHRYLQVIVFLVILALDISDLASDWLFYADVSIAEQGLVYGLPDQKAVVALFVFSIIGTITFIFETCNLGKEIFTGEPWFNVDLITAIILWTEDVPQITINVVIALCREDPISIFQLVKASIIILGIIIRIIISLARYCSKASLAELKEKTKTSRLHVTYHVFIMLGLLLNFAGAASVFFFTQTQRDLDRKIIYEVPDTIFEEKYHDDRYFKNVSIYLHHPTFDVVETTNASEVNWMRLIKINSVRNLPKEIVMFSYEYEETPTELKMVLWENSNCSAWIPVECYTLTKPGGILTKETNCASFLGTGVTSVIFKFIFIPPDHIFRKLIFGDIKFNVKTKNHIGACNDVSSGNVTDHLDLNVDHVTVTIHYYRTDQGEENHIVSKAGVSRFYRLADFEDITTVWKTGWLSCETKGSLAPHVDRSIVPPCERTGKCG